MGILLVKQVSSDGHQMSLTGEGPHVPYLEKGLEPGSGGPCFMGNGHMGIPLPSPTVARLTHTRVKTLPSLNFVGGHEKFSIHMAYPESKDL